MGKELNEVAVGLSIGILSAVCIFVLGILGFGGMMQQRVMAMQQWHMFFSLSPAGIILGMIEAFIVWFIGGYVFAWLYNQLAKKLEKKSR